MTIEYSKHKNMWKADCIDLSGMPPVGYGKTKDEACIYLLLGILQEHQMWGKYIDKPIILEEIENDK